MKLKINIVGLHHSDVRQTLVEYARSAKGKYFMLLPDKENKYDPMAVKVYDGTTVVGYLAAQDAEDVKALMLASGKNVLRTHCTGFKAKEDGESGIYLTAVVRENVKGESEILKYVPIIPLSHNTESNSIPELEVSGGKVITMGSNAQIYPMPLVMSQAYAQLYDDGIYEKWHYSGPVFSINRLARIEDCADMLATSLQDLLEQQIDFYRIDDAARLGVIDSSVRAEKEDEINFLEKEATVFLSDFIPNHRFDYSREMTKMRKHVQTLLALSEKPNFMAQREVLLSEMGFLTCSKYREEAAHLFFIDTPIEELKRKNGNYDYSDRIDEIEQELENFPYELYRKFKADPVDFLREIFYKRVPRQKMKQLLSGIIFMIMNHRVDDVKIWGKYNDRIALQEMRELRHIKLCQAVMSEEERAEKAQRCIRKMAVEPGKSGYGWMIKSQADWYVVQRVLVDAELIDIRDHAPFCSYIAEVLSQEGASGEKANASDGGGTSDGKVSLDESILKVRNHVPLCKKKDLDQASVEVFEKTPPREWSRLSDDKLGGVQQAKFNHYCDIVEVMLGLL